MTEKFPQPRIPVATYRLQFNQGFGFAEATKIIPYLHELGITDIYASPYLKAKAGSRHGYDIVDHGALNPEVGTWAACTAMTDELGRHGMGQILDIVPNHMCIDSRDNSWWMDVLENGPSSMYADFFDIDWHPIKEELENKVLLPILGDQYGQVLEDRELRLAYEDGAFAIYYYDNRFPVRPGSYALILEHGLDRLGARVRPDHPWYQEFLSIITAIRNLPLYTDTDPARTTERHREKEVVKKRLLALCRECPAIRKFIEENVRRFNGCKAQPGSFDLLDNLLREQVYRLAHWRVAADEINYRRFFDINNLAAIRMERPEVFRETHGLVLRMVREGRVTGLRVDHPDGLYNPSEYLGRLQQSCCAELVRALETGDPGLEATAPCVTMLAGGHKPFYIVGEKILIKGETMPEEWPIFSTTGYVFLNSVNGIFIDSQNAAAFDKIYARIIRDKVNYPETVAANKRLIMQVAMSSEIGTLGHYLNLISEKDRHTRDFTLNSLKQALVEVAAFFPVYRTYINEYGVTDRDRQYIEVAVARAKRKNPAISVSLFDFVKDILLLRLPGDSGEPDRRQWLDFVMRFQQITGPVMAKGVEDTTFYGYNRLISLNEVGGMPDRFGTPVDTFHGQNIERRKFWPHALIATSTHDTKRGEDVRTRINVLSERPEEWKRHLSRWFRWNKRKKTAVDGRLVPDPNEEYFLYQTLVGAWPPAGPDNALWPRIRDYMLKAVREAKQNSSWISPSVAYEEALLAFVDRLGDDGRFLADLGNLAGLVGQYGVYNSLAQTLLKITAPGVPDFYQGTELWHLCLVDPDNRGAVDFDLRVAMLKELAEREAAGGRFALARQLIDTWQDGRVKLFLTWKALTCRRLYRELFEQGEYLALSATGPRAGNLCAFARQLDSGAAITVTPRLVAGLARPGVQPLGAEVWFDTFLPVPLAEQGLEYENVFTGEIVTVQEKNGALGLALAAVLACFPVALLVNRHG